MRVRSRTVLAFAVFLYCVWAGATEVRHYAGTPDAGMHWLFVAPAAAALTTAVGLALEHLQARGLGQEIRDLRRVGGVPLALQFVGLSVFAWRSIWMFFSWDGMFFFPAFLGLAVAVILRWHLRWIPEA